MKKALIFLTILVILGVGAATQKDVMLFWFYDPTLGYLAKSASSCISTYQSYCDESGNWTFPPGEWEIGQAYETLGLGKSLYLSVQFLGAEAFSRYDLASSLGLDYFTLSKLNSAEIQEIF